MLKDQFIAQLSNSTGSDFSTKSHFFAPPKTPLWAVGMHHPCSGTQQRAVW